MVEHSPKILASEEKVTTTTLSTFLRSRLKDCVIIWLLLYGLLIGLSLYLALKSLHHLLGWIKLD